MNATTIKTALTSSYLRKVGEGLTAKVFTHDLHRYMTIAGLTSLDLGAFKAELIKLHTARQIELTRCDLVQAFKADDIKASDIEHNGATFNFVRVS